LLGCVLPHPFFLSIDVGSSKLAQAALKPWSSFFQPPK
jgi:hypothetical protein